MINIFQYKKGFSLIELLVTIGIIILLTAAAIPGFSTYRSKQDLNSAADITQSKIYDARSYALAPEESKDNSVRYYALSIINNTIGIYEKDSISPLDIEKDKLVDEYRFIDIISFENDPDYLIFFSIDKNGKIETVTTNNADEVILDDANIVLTIKSEKVKNSVKTVVINNITGQATIE